MTNAEIIASTLDGLLDHEVSLVAYGRASIALGFERVPEAVGRSLDMDVILRFSNAAELDEDDQFWEAQAKVNTVLEKQGLYITHLFQEDQVFLRPEWGSTSSPCCARRRAGSNSSDRPPSTSS